MRGRLFLPFLIFVSACTAGTPLRKHSGIRASDQQRDRVIKAVSERSIRLIAGRSLARVKIKSDQEKQSFRMTMVFSKPEKLRIETLPQIGSYPLSLLNLDGTGYRYTDYMSKSTWEGDNPEEVIEEVFGFAVPVEVLLNYLAGTVADLTVENTGCYIEESDDEVLCVSQKGDLLFTAGISDLNLRSLELAEPDSDFLAVRISYTDHKETGGVVIPYSIQINIPDQETDISINYSVVRLESGPGER